MELQSGLKEEEANIATTVSAFLPVQPLFQQLSFSEREELLAMLDNDVRKMKCLFGSLVTTTCDSVEQRIPVRKFASSILALGAYDPAPGERDRSLLNEHREEIKMAESIVEIFMILNAYWNYLNYDLLEYIIEHYGTRDDAERLMSYGKQLHSFCRRRIYEFPPESGNESMLSPKQKKFCVVLDVREDIPCQQLRQIRGRFAQILQVSPNALIIQGVDKGIGIQLQRSEGEF